MSYKKIKSMSPEDRARFFSRLRSYVYVYCEVDEESRRIPFYIGKGTGPRCFDHLNERGSSKKIKRIRHLMSTDRLDIDILAYGLDNRTAQEIESACIDLMGIDYLTNYVRGRGENIKRSPIFELSNELLEKKVKVSPKHRGVAILINRDYKPTFGDLELFEITRGIWRKNMMTLAGESKYAYAVNKKVVKEVYEIRGWVPAGTQQYFSRTLDPERLKNHRWEFVGRKAGEDVRKKYVGRVLDFERSFGNSFVKVGYD